MNVGNIHRFEEKLRETEQNLGVKEGISYFIIIQLGKLFLNIFHAILLKMLQCMVVQFLCKFYSITAMSKINFKKKRIDFISV